MKKGNNNNIFPPHLLNFWINKEFREGVVIRRNKKTKEVTTNEITKEEKKEDEDILKYFTHICKHLFGAFIFSCRLNLFL